MFPAPTFSAPTLVQLWRDRAWKIGPGCVYDTPVYTVVAEVKVGVLKGHALISYHKQQNHISYRYDMRHGTACYHAIAHR